MSVAILGCGYVGRAVAQRWQAEGFSVSASTTRPERVSELYPFANRVLVVRGNDTAGLQALLHDQRCLLVSVAGGRSQGYESVYLETAKTLAALVPQLPDLAQIIYTSSFSVYGDYSGAWVSETDSLKPATANAAVLAETEQTLLALSQPQRPVCVLRLGGIYGPGRELAQIFSRSAGSLRPGAGSEWSNWIHLNDIVGAIAFARQQRLSGVYNLVQDEIVPVRQLLERVCTAHGLPPVRWDAAQPSDRPYNVRVANTKLKAAGYQFVHPYFDLSPDLSSDRVPEP